MFDAGSAPRARAPPGGPPREALAGQAAVILPAVQLLSAAHPDDPPLDMAVSHALLRAVASGASPATARVYVPGPAMAFGRLDALRDGFAQAREAAIAHGYGPLLRLGGGHAAAYDAGSLVVELLEPQETIAGGLQERFADGTRLLQDALAAAGAPTELGELPGEYCPGRWSLHLPAGPKVMGASQRVIRGASLFTAVVVVGRGAAMREALTDVYAALGLTWHRPTAGSLDEHVPGLTVEAVREAVLAALRERGELTDARPSFEVLAAARSLVSHHRL